MDAIGMSNGVLYIGMGQNFIREAEYSAKLLKQSNEDIPATLVTDREPSTEYIDKTITIDNPEHTFADKPFNMDKLPYDKTLFLDTDTYVYSDISEIFSLLDNFDVAAAHNSNRDIYTYVIGDTPKAFPEYNTGVILFKRNEKVMSFISEWERIYCENADDDWPDDQPSFRKALYESNLRIATLPPEYNCILRNPGHVVDEVKIFHSRLLDIETVGASKYFSFDVEEAAEQLNKTGGHRLHYGLQKFTVKTQPWDPITTRMLVSLRENGLISTAMRGATKIKEAVRSNSD